MTTATATSATTATTATTANTKRTSAFHVGLEKMRDANVLDTCTTLATDMAKVVSENSEKGFDLLYVNMPWKTVSMDYASALPVADLVKGRDHAGLLLWVDGPCVEKANTLLKTWGFTFHSVLHVTSYTNPSVSASSPAAAAVVVNAGVGVDGTVAVSEDNGGGGDGHMDVATDESAVVPPSTPKPSMVRKGLVPHGWLVDGIVPSRTRQLWFAVRNAGGDDASTVTTPYLKDASFIRKRLQATSVFEYSKTTEANAATTLSSKKKNLDSWQVFPEYDAYVPDEVRLALENIHKPTARVLSLFADSINRNWHTWGPNIPGYVSCPLRPDGGFPSVSALLKYFSSMKGATVQKYLTLMNLYAVQYAKDLGNVDTPELDEDGNPKKYLTALVTGRMDDFFTDLKRRYHEGGVIAASALAATSAVKLEQLSDFTTLAADVQAQILLLVGQIIRLVLKKNSEATERRKKAIKRKRELTGEDGDGEVEAKPRIPRKFGIAAPVDISPDLSKFMGLSEGEKVARTTVVKFINEYIGKHQLQNPQKKSEINCDQALQQLLNPAPTFGAVTYFNLCKLLGPHFLSSSTKGTTIPPSSHPPLAPGKEAPPAATPLLTPTQGVA